MESSPDGSSAPRIIQWILDTRPLWPVSPKAKVRDEVAELKTVAARALTLLSGSEQTSVLKYYHIRDAKMSLASHLLKHLVITRHCHVPWSDSNISRDSNGKPIFIPGPGQPSIDFNVSHQAGLVSLIAAVGYEKDVKVGTDVVCVTERRKSDYAHIEKEGFFDWVNMHGDVFAESEISHMRIGPVSLVELGLEARELSGFAKNVLSRCQKRNENIQLKGIASNGHESVTVESNLVIDAKLRRFYAMWCLREAYVKMTGEALLAPWLKNLEMIAVEAPAAREEASGLAEGEVKREFRIIFKERRVTDVEMELTALGADFMVGGAVRVPKELGQAQVALGMWEELDLDRDILRIAESAA